MAPKNRPGSDRLSLNRPASKRSAPARPAPGMPSREQILEFIQNSAEPAGKREISKHFGLQGSEKIQLKALLKDMAEEGLIDGRRTAYHRMGGVPRVTVLRVVDIDEGEAIAIPDTWTPEDATRRRVSVWSRRDRKAARAARRCARATGCCRAPRRAKPAGAPGR